VIPAILHFNYFSFDRDTLFTISKEEFELKNKNTDKTIRVKKTEIEKIFAVGAWTGKITWGHEYTVFKLSDGRTLKISNYVINLSEIVEFLELDKIVITRDITVPTISRGKLDNELRTV
jgi:hypothetical protein